MEYSQYFPCLANRCYPLPYPPQEGLHVLDRCTAGWRGPNTGHIWSPLKQLQSRSSLQVRVQMVTTLLQSAPAPHCDMPRDGTTAVGDHQLSQQPPQEETGASKWESCHRLCKEERNIREGVNLDFNIWHLYQFFPSTIKLLSFQPTDWCQCSSVECEVRRVIITPDLDCNIISLGESSRLAATTRNLRWWCILWSSISPHYWSHTRIINI